MWLQVFQASKEEIGVKMGFFKYDLAFLAIFVIVFLMFVFFRRKNFHREGLLLLYRTKIGLKFIDYVGKKYTRLLNFLDYIIIFTGYVLMAAIVYLFANMVYVFVKTPAIAQTIKVPPIMPLIPYLPSLFKIDFLPEFYFTYWIIVLAIIAIGHEFSHGIFARHHNVNVKATGFGFLGPFLAAFVEPDEKQMAKKGMKPQLSILSAGSFANIIMTIIFFIILILFFKLAFIPSGVIFNTYYFSQINVSQISSIDGISFSNPSAQEILSQFDNIQENKLEFDNIKLNFTEIKTDKTYLIDTSSLKKSLEAGNIQLIAFDDFPAIKVGLKGAISEFNGVKISDSEQLSEELLKYGPYQNVTLKTISEEKEISYNISLGEKDGKAFLGVAILEYNRGLTGFFYKIFTFFKDPSTYYTAGNFSMFIYNLLWWIVLINLSVGLVNMLPLGIFDGGRVFYLTILAITKKEKKARLALKLVTILLLLLLLVSMVYWWIGINL